VKICKEYGTVIRIGVNHGSLSDRILSKYGDTAEGMVESAFEFFKICESHNFDQIVVSMKASNPLVMVGAYRLLVSKMIERNQNIYPLHLGVTEAGEAEDGRVKSALGIGALLAEGIGDTVRVSLTEPPEFEIPVAKAIINHFSKSDSISIQETQEKEFLLPNNPFAPEKLFSKSIENIGGNQVPRVIGDVSYRAKDSLNNKFNGMDLIPLGHYFSFQLDKWNMSDLGVDYIYAGDGKIDFMLPNGLKVIYNYSNWLKSNDTTHSFPFFNSFDDYKNASKKSLIINFVVIHKHNLPEIVHEIEKGSIFVGVIEASTKDDFHKFRELLNQIKLIEINIPVIVKINTTLPEIDFGCNKEELLQIVTSCSLSVLLIDGYLDGIWFENSNHDYNPETLNRLSFNLLQASRCRISKTEYISCPSCGRTLFDLQETTAMIRKRTEHLKGVKIAIMGCIVNGPGEMADADYGYVGAGVGLVSLYKGKEMVEKSVKTEIAVDKLIELIKQYDQWIEPIDISN